MNFGAPYFIFGFILPVIFSALFSLGHSKSKSERRDLLDANVERTLIKKTRAASRRRKLTVLTFIFLVLALIRPQLGFREVKEEREGIDLLFLVDVSNSMLAKDPSPNRLERVRFIITDLLQHLHGDRIGLVTFAGVAFMESPLTYDYGTFRLFLEDLSPNLIPVQGTNLQGALEEAVKTFEDSKGNIVDGREKVILLFSDGEEVSGAVLGAAKKLAKSKVKIFSIGVGTESGAPVPERNGYKHDRDGKVVISRLQTSVLKEVAVVTGGSYLEGVLTGENLRKFYDEQIAASATKSRITGGVVRVWNEYYQLPLALGMFTLIFSVAGIRNIR